MQPMLKVNTMNLKPRKSVLLGTSALVCLALAAPVMADGTVADVFEITGSEGTTNGVGIAPDAIDGSDTVSLGIDLETGGSVGIRTTNNNT